MSVGEGKVPKIVYHYLKFSFGIAGDIAVQRIK